MRSFASFSGLATFLAQRAATLPTVERAVLGHVGGLIQHQAQSFVGTYDAPGPWPQLAESTQADRARKGFPENEPLLRTGELERSIKHKVEGRTVHIGSDLDAAVFQELGTARIPPRSFLASAAVVKEGQAVRLVGRAVSAHLAGRDASAVTKPGVPDL